MVTVTLPPGRLVYDARLLQVALGLGRTATYRLLKRHGVRLGGRVLIVREKLLDLLEHGEPRPPRLLAKPRRAPEPAR